MTREDYFYSTGLIRYNECFAYYAPIINRLICINPKIGEVTTMFSPVQNNYHTIVEYNGDIILFPTYNDSLCEYNPSFDRANYSLIPEVHLDTETNWSGRYIRYNDYLYFYWQAPVITRYDLKNKQWRAYRDWKRFVPENFKPDVWFEKEAFIYSNKAFFILASGPLFLVIDLETDEVNVDELDFDDSSISIGTSHYCDGQLWLQTQNDNGLMEIYRCDIENHVIQKEFTLSLKSTSKSIFGIMEVYGNKLILIPAQFDKIVIIDLHHQTETIVSNATIYDKVSLFLQGRLPYNYICGIRIEKYYYTVNIKNGRLLVIDCENNKVIEKKLLVGDLFTDYGINTLAESEAIGLEEYVDFVSSCREN